MGYWLELGAKIKVKESLHISVKDIFERSCQSLTDDWVYREETEGIGTGIRTHKIDVRYEVDGEYALELLNNLMSELNSHDLIWSLNVYALSLFGKKQ